VGGGFEELVCSVYVYVREGGESAGGVRVKGGNETKRVEKRVRTYLRPTNAAILFVPSCFFSALKHKN